MVASKKFWDVLSRWKGKELDYTTLTFFRKMRTMKQCYFSFYYCNLLQNYQKLRRTKTIKHYHICSFLCLYQENSN